MIKNRLTRWIGIMTLAVAAVLLTVHSTKAQATPFMELTNSVNNWTVQTGSSLTLNASLNPSNYRTLSRVEIRQNNNVLATCWNQNTCSYALGSVASGTTSLQAIGYDVDGRIFYSSVMNLNGQNLNNSVGGPDVSLSATSYEVNPVANSGMYIEARATDGTRVRDLRIYRTDDWRLEVVSNCSNNPYDCTVRTYPVFSSADAGRTYTYEAQATDEQGNAGATRRITVYVRTQVQSGSGTNQMPGIYLDRGTVPETVNANTPVNIRAEAWDNESLNRMAIYVTRPNAYGYGYNSNESYQFPFTKTCYSSGNNLSCTLSIGSFWGYEGQTFDVWAEVFDASGQRTMSNTYTMRVAGTSNSTNEKPSVYFTSPALPLEVNSNQSVSLQAYSTDQGGLYRMSITATPMVYSYGYGNNYSQYRFHQNCEATNLPKTLSCTLNIPNFYGYEGQTFDVWATAFDGYNYSNSILYTIKVRGNTSNLKPGVAINTTLPSEVKSDATLTIQAEGWDYERLAKLTLYATPEGQNSLQNTCYSTGTNVKCSLNVNLSGYAGKNFSVWAEVTDAAGQQTVSRKYNFKVVPATSTPTRTSPVVQTTLPNNVTSLAEDKSIIVSGKATSPTGVWGVEVRAQPSWTNEPIVRRCIMSSKTISVGTCDMNLGPFRGRANGTVKVWTIAWDGQSGMGGSSETKTIKITGVTEQNFAPSVNITPSRRAIANNQTVNWVVNASDTNGIEKIEVYVNARIVKTCTRVATCSYTGGPYRSYAGTSISYAAKVWDKTGKTTWTGYEYIQVNNSSVSRATSRTASAR